MLKRWVVMVFALSLMLGTVTVKATDIVEKPPKTGGSTTVLVETYGDNQPDYTGWLKFTVFVKDENGNPFPNVLINITRSIDGSQVGIGVVPPINGSSEGGYMTGKDGKLTFYLYPADTNYIMTISQPGYERVETGEFSITSDSEVTIQLVKLSSTPSPSPFPTYSGGIGPIINPQPSPSPTLTPTPTPTPTITPTPSPTPSSTPTPGSSPSPSPSPSPSGAPDGSESSPPIQSSEPSPTSALGDGEIVVPPMDVRAYEIILGEGRSLDEEDEPITENNETHHPISSENRPPLEECAIHWWMFPWILLTLIGGLIRLWYLRKRDSHGTDKHDPEEEEMMFK